MDTKRFEELAALAKSANVEEYHCFWRLKEVQIISDALCISADEAEEYLFKVAERRDEGVDSIEAEASRLNDIM